MWIHFWLVKERTPKKNERIVATLLLEHRLFVIKSIARILPIAFDKFTRKKDTKIEKWPFFMMLPNSDGTTARYGVEMPHNMEQMRMSVSHKSTKNRWRKKQQQQDQRNMLAILLRKCYAYCSQNMYSAVKFTDDGYPEAYSYYQTRPSEPTDEPTIAGDAYFPNSSWFEFLFCWNETVGAFFVILALRTHSLSLV